ncbi:50S ribosomal protein L6 [Methanosarcina mazei]|jgi:large subunit ribosomal protein L6|uniref:Large ribosomal subunit protein uL6 n=8 Tax=Methanosarcina mazei TaxID=2209 RepID=RL6_METMA|nr:50S ribosomal protein L6 [Methanosarcina mazei]Q8PV34.1 RecName: Full=Large ribosomal subunit protein uL6; AltName: Full=50S ribosomal protein L6 [Methanosarcina mazei Go1]AAM31836.1 LSU ribosomal protein L6P [Methanosarcina mazei Go1]AGF97519.1 LSU ribosomal protein L9e (L6p) [Methanosarcina mazei Tuc01]AKB41493.1 LSU ribosomal protein L9e (L6p) [Methanosarcina mazei WWM610]AKB62406.1 LSU ribosomal protein L9e (L6p) [Methanosarcina mazei SarPi]AKB65740.1 LSU ribosomal protein L9e (L6p) [M
MVKEIARTIEIPEGVSVSLSQDVFTAKGPKGTVERTFWYPGIKIEVREGEVVVDAESSRKEQKAMVGTFASHLKNLIIGVSEGFECKMNIVYAHFPMQVKVEGKTLVIGNFLGEKKPRIAKILGETKVKVSGNEIVVSGINKEDVGQTAANIEQKTKIKRFDPRIFQDGIYIVQKA